MTSVKNMQISFFDIWTKEGTYAIEYDSQKQKWFQIFAYPGPSGFLHVGTLRSYTYPDVIAKFKRFTGYNVYFPAGIHASGLPAVQFSEKVKSGKYTEYLQNNNCTPEIIEHFQTPEKVVYFFRNNYASIWKEMGFFINAETGIPTTIDAGYKKFISWQFRTLYKHGFLVQREYISSYCPKDGPVAIDTAETDLSSGGNARIVEKYVWCFTLTEKITTKSISYENVSIVVTSDFSSLKIQPGSIFAQKDDSYSLISYQNSYLIVATDCISNIKHIFENYTIITEISSKDIINKSAVNPFTQLTIPIEADDNRKNGIGTGFTYVEQFNNNYKQEDSTIKETIIINKTVKKGYFFTERVICRCGEVVQIRYVPDQWFIRYSDPNITKSTKMHINKHMTIYPKSFSKEINQIVSWFGDRPCVRTGAWLGTKFPIASTNTHNSDFIIEPIADSTIYPAYYLISKYINNAKIDPEKINDEFFDYIFLHQGEANSVNRNTGFQKEIIEKIQTEFESWYPVDCNFGGKEHKTVHFPVYIKMHTMMFPQKYWPRKIFVNWWVMQNINTNTKIGKSKGGAGSIGKLIAKYSADAIRLYYCHAASAHVDIEWSEEEVKKYQKEIEKTKEFIISFMTEEILNFTENEDICSWLEYKLIFYFIEMYDKLNQFDIQKMCQICYYSIPKIFSRFTLRKGVINYTIRELINEWLCYIAMITPFMAEEVNFKLGNKNSIFSSSRNLKRHEKKNPPFSVEEEEFIDNVVNDIIKTKKATKKINNPTVYIYTHEKPFPSANKENEILNSALGYIVKKTNSTVIIDSNVDYSKKKFEIKPRKPKLIIVSD